MGWAMQRVTANPTMQLGADRALPLVEHIGEVGTDPLASGPASRQIGLPAGRSAPSDTKSADDPRSHHA